MLHGVEFGLGEAFIQAIYCFQGFWVGKGKRVGSKSDDISMFGVEIYVIDFGAPFVYNVEAPPLDTYGLAFLVLVRHRSRGVSSEGNCSAMFGIVRDKKCFECRKINKCPEFGCTYICKRSEKGTWVLVQAAVKAVADDVGRKCEAENCQPVLEEEVDERCCDHDAGISKLFRCNYGVSSRDFVNS